MDGIPGLKTKAFIVERFDDRKPLKATIESCERAPRMGWANFLELPPEVQEALREPDGLKLTMPDGSEWFIDDKTWEGLLPLIQRSREHFAEQA